MRFFIMTIFFSSHDNKYSALSLQILMLCLGRLFWWNLLFWMQSRKWAVNSNKTWKNLFNEVTTKSILGLIAFGLSSFKSIEAIKCVCCNLESRLHSNWHPCCILQKYLFWSTSLYSADNTNNNFSTMTQWQFSLCQNLLLACCLSQIENKVRED